MKQYELTKQNALIAYQHLCRQLQILNPSFFDYSFELGNPKVTGEIPVTIKMSVNKTLEQTMGNTSNTLYAITCSESEAQVYKVMGYEL